MLHNNALYLLEKDQDSNVPTTESIKYQVAKCVRGVSGSVRLAEGRVVGDDSKKPSRIKRIHSYSNNS